MFVCPVRARRLLAKRSARGAYFNPRARLGHDFNARRTVIYQHFNPRARLGHDMTDSSSADKIYFHPHNVPTITRSKKIG